MTDKYTRLTGLLELLTQRGKLDIDEVAVELGVSAATIRRDFDHLAQQQLLTRTRGGAVSNSVSYDLPLRYKTSKNVDEKQRIGAAAAALVRRGTILGLTGGTTSTEVARAITARGSLQIMDGEPAVTIVTNAVNIANELTVRPQVKIVMTGGVARPQSYELIGPLAQQTLENLTLDMAILGVNGIDPAYGASADNEGEAGINAMMAARARQVVVVADSSKLGHRAFARICPISDVDVLITDTSAADAAVAEFEKAGVDTRRV
ncbi:MAG TPA: DeoR/GlpR family DNA-binding transcription regulator [Streptosporangiaceae bacterium]|nr:DeoR/GlpR family DNA-binding transcription regulator [Streptosporangiaceae bacterium]